MPDSFPSAANHSYLSSAQPAEVNDAAVDRRYPPVSWNVWIMAMFINLMFMGMMHDFRSAGLSLDEVEQNRIEGVSAMEDSVGAALPERKAAFVLAFLLVIYCFATAKRKITWESQGLAILIAVAMMWVFASWLWSIDQPKTTKELIRVAVYAALAYGLAIRYTAYEVVWLVMLTSIYTVGVSCAFEIFIGAPESADEAYRLAGSLHPNPIGRFATMIAIPALCFARVAKKARWRFVLLLIASLVIIQLTKSRTALGCCVVGLASIYAFSDSWRRLLVPSAVFSLVASLGFLVLGIAGSSGLESSGSAVTMGRGDQVGSLTGRLPLWESLLRRSQNYRVQGFGYGAFWNTENNESIHDEVHWQAGHAHSAYVETVIGLGVVGLGLLLATCVYSTTVCAWRAIFEGAVEYQILAAIMVSAMLNGVTEGGYILARELAVFSAMFAISAAMTPAWRTSTNAATEPVPSPSPAPSTKLSYS